MEKICSRCGKIFNPDGKVLKMVDSNGNELYVNLCDKCELKTMVEKVIELKHVSREEAERYVVNQINDLIDKMIDNVVPYNNGDVIKYDNDWQEYSSFWKRLILNRSLLNGIIKVVKDERL